MEAVTTENVASNQPSSVKPEETPVNTAEQGKTEAVKPSPAQVEGPTQVSPAQDLRNIQQLIVLGVFPGQCAPEIVKAYLLLEDMCLKIEKTAATK